MLVRFYASERNKDILVSKTNSDVVLSVSTGALSLKSLATQTNFGSCDVVVTDMSALRDTDDELFFAVNYLCEVYSSLTLIFYDDKRCVERFPGIKAIVHERIRYTNSRDALIECLPDTCVSLVSEIVPEPVKDDEQASGGGLANKSNAPLNISFMLNDNRRPSSQRERVIKTPEPSVNTPPDDMPEAPLDIAPSPPPMLDMPTTDPPSKEKPVPSRKAPRKGKPKPSVSTSVEPASEADIQTPSGVVSGTTEDFVTDNPTDKPHPTVPVITPSKTTLNPPAKTVFISICGLFHRLGVTTQALGMAYYLKEQGKSVLVVEDNGHGHMDMLPYYYDHAKDEQTGITRIYDIAFFDARRMNTIPTGFDFVIYDLGVMGSIHIKHFMAQDISIICVGNKPWEMQMLIDVYKTYLHNDFRAYLFFPFVAEDERADMLRMTGPLKDRAHFLNDSPSLFTYAPNEAVYASLFAAWLQGGDSMRSGAKPANGRIIHMDRTHKKK